MEARKMIFTGALAIALVSCGESRLEPQPELLPTAIEGLELTFSDPELPDYAVSIEFTSETTGFIGCGNGKIAKTIDGGLSWTQVASVSSTVPIMEINFINANDGWAVGSTLLKTTNGGDTWEEVSITDKTIELNSVLFINSQLGFVVGNGSIFRTIDGGSSWSETTFDNFGSQLYNIQFFDDKNGLVSGLFNKLITTDDGGKTWNVVTAGKDVNFAELSVPEGSVALASRYNKIYRSTDMGDTWTTMYTFNDDASNILSLNFTSEQTGFAFGSGEYSGGDLGHSMGAIYYTKDGGASWIGADNVHEIYTIASASFPTPDVGYAVSIEGLVKIRVK